MIRSPQAAASRPHGEHAFDVARIPLSGASLIEANAGTGKTWTITALYLRLLIEAGCGVESILVVTFTEAASGELRDRIRRRLAQARSAFEAQAVASDDEFLAALVARAPDRVRVAQRLDVAICEFDRAPIYTIHGFCQRVLGDSAFESGLPFGTELVPDQSALIGEVVEDYWRNRVHGASPLFARFLVGTGLAPAGLASSIQPYLGRPYLRLEPRVAPPDAAPLEEAYAAAYAAAREIWLAQRAAIAEQLERSDLHARSYRREAISGWLDEMHACLAGEAPTLELCDKFDKFTPQTLAKATRKNGAVPEHPFFDACRVLREAHSALATAYAQRVIHMKIELIEHVRSELEVRKAHARVQSFDDLLVNLDSALTGPRGTRLAAMLRERYKAALIDEFQDTDPVQYGIFSRIYAGSAQPLFLVGDPKQSIYSFRGADVYVYLDARACADRTHSLDVNWRSTPPLLEAVNALFSCAPQPFVIPEIEYVPSRAAGDRGMLEIDGDEGAPFEIWFAESAEGAISKGEMGERSGAATASEIARLLDLSERGKAWITEDGRRRRLAGGDIAVLVRSHRQASAIRRELASRGVASVQRDGVGIFETREAEELERVLAAIAEPARESLIGAALVTDMLGFDGEALLACRSDEAAWEARVESFRAAHRAWHECGFIRMIHAFLQSYGVLARLLEFSDGERRATNLRHAIELIHAHAGDLGVGGLLAWLAGRRRLPSQGIDAELLRLESDENLVRISTMHAAKGLEFPLVFCPFLWDGAMWSRKDEAVAFHERTAEGRYVAVVDFGSPEQDTARARAMLEERAETLRLAYVALTRAKYRCWMAWGCIKDAQTSAPAWLLHRAQGEDVPQLAPAQMRRDLAALAASARGAIRISAFPAPRSERFEPPSAETHVYQALPFTGDIRDTRRVTSFSALAHGRTIEAPDYDAADRPRDDERLRGRDIFAFPRGAQPGKCLHAIFEHTDFSRLERAELERVAARELALHGIESHWSGVLADTIEAVVATPLDASGLRLAEVARGRRLDELEFYYPISRLTERSLRSILSAGGFPDEIRSRIGTLTFAPARGYMRGFIDLVFEHGGRYYLADYKSNWLGAEVAAYDTGTLARAMARESYYLQYLVYCVALHRYLAARLRDYRYERHFGGVRYLFVRGMRPESGPAYGVFADRPDESLIAALDRHLASGAR